MTREEPREPRQPLRNRPEGEKLLELQTLLGVSCAFVELLATLHTLRFTGAVELQFLNGQPQAATLGRPLVLRFAEHPANRGEAPDGAENLTASAG